MADGNQGHLDYGHLGDPASPSGALMTTPILWISCEGTRDTPDTPLLTVAKAEAQVSVPLPRALTMRLGMPGALQDPSVTNLVLKAPLWFVLKSVLWS